MWVCHSLVSMQRDISHKENNGRRQLPDQGSLVNPVSKIQTCWLAFIFNMGTIKSSCCVRNTTKQTEPAGDQPEPLPEIPIFLFLMFTSIFSWCAGVKSAHCMLFLKITPEAMGPLRLILKQWLLYLWDNLCNGHRLIKHQLWCKFKTSNAPSYNSSTELFF